MSSKEFSLDFLDNLSLCALSSQRGRKNFNLHHEYAEPCQRLFNAIGVDSYIHPHRHMQDPKRETLIAVRGMFALVIFDEVGRIKRFFKFGTEKFLAKGVFTVGVELSPDVWHTVIALIGDSILLEVKSGPFVPATAKELAPWAPKEGTNDSVNYLNQLKLKIK